MGRSTGGSRDNRSRLGFGGYLLIRPNNTTTSTKTVTNTETGPTTTQTQTVTTTTTAVPAPITLSYVPPLSSSVQDTVNLVVNESG